DPPRELPEAERVCPDCGLPMVACGTEDTEQLEIEIVIYRRRTRRCRYKRTCQCSGQRTWTAPPLPKLIPKGILGVSVWTRTDEDGDSSRKSPQDGDSSRTQDGTGRTGRHRTGRTGTVHVSHCDSRFWVIIHIYSVSHTSQATCV